MTPFLVRVRTKPLPPALPIGEMLIYIAVFETAEEALAGTARELPDGWHAEQVIGVAEDSIAEQYRFRPGHVELLA